MSSAQTPAPNKITSQPQGRVVLQGLGQGLCTVGADPVVLNVDLLQRPVVHQGLSQGLCTVVADLVAQQADRLGVEQVG